MNPEILFMTNNDARKATSKDKNLIVHILTESFYENQSINYVIKKGENKRKYVETLMVYSFNMCLEFGEVWITTDNSACVMFLYSEKERSTLKSVIWDLTVAIKSFGLFNVKKIIQRQKRIKSFYSDSKYLYLFYIGVLPDSQSLGKGTMLLNDVTSLASESGLTVYLETSVERNLPWYKKLGFELYKTLNFDYDLFLMVKKVNE